MRIIYPRRAIFPCARCSPGPMSRVGIYKKGRFIRRRRRRRQKEDEIACASSGTRVPMRICIYTARIQRRIAKGRCNESTRAVCALGGGKVHYTQNARCSRRAGPPGTVDGGCGPCALWWGIWVFCYRGGVRRVL